MWPRAEDLRRALAARADATVLGDGNACWSGEQVLAQVGQRHALLETLGSARVALAMDNSADWVLWDLALLASARVAVPVPGFFSAAQQRHLVDSAGVDTLIGATDEDAARLGFRALTAADGALPQGWRVAQRAVGSVPGLPPGTAKITFTSGTTGQPKGVCLDATTLLAVADGVRQATQGIDVQRHLCVLPLATLLENVAGVYAPLLSGACVELRPMHEIGLLGAAGLDLPRLLRSLHAVQPHSVILLPQLLLALVGAAEQGLALPGSLRFVAVGGGRVAPQLLRRAEALGLPVFEGYGLSEAGSVVCLNTPQARRIGTVGRVLPHAGLRLAPDGEVLVRGPRMLGYLGETGSADPWLATGDLGHLDDGFLVLHGRRKNIFITAYGRNVHPEWVESELVQQTAIAQAWLHGEARASNVAVLVPRGPAIGDAALQAAVDAVNAGLPDYARVHQWLRAEAPFTAATGLTTDNGRLRRGALLQRYAGAIDALPSPAGPTLHPTETA